MNKLFLSFSRLSLNISNKSLFFQPYLIRSFADLKNENTANKLKSDENIVTKTTKKSIKVSPRKLVPVANLVSGMTVPEALKQLQFSHKKIATVVAKTVQNAANLADIRYEIPPEKLVITQSIVGRGSYDKRVRYQSRGRHGIMYRKHSHLTIQVEEKEPEHLTKHQKRVRRDQNRLRAQIRAREEEANKPQIEIKE